MGISDLSVPHAFAGVMLMLRPGWAALCLFFFASVRVTGSKRKWAEAGAITSLTSWLLFTLLMLAFETPQDAGRAVLMTLFLAWRHKKNFQILRVRGPRKRPHARLTNGRARVGEPVR